MRPTLYLNQLDGWMYWAVYVLAYRRTSDVAMSVRTAQKACASLWNDD